MFTPMIKNQVILHNPLIGRILVAVFIALASWQYGWKGFVVAITFWVFWLLLQFSQTLRFMRLVAQNPPGVVKDAVGLGRNLRKDMSMLEVIRLSQCLGIAVPMSHLPPPAQGCNQCWEWRDECHHAVVVYFRGDRCIYWTLQLEHAVAPAELSS